MKFTITLLFLSIAIWRVYEIEALPLNSEILHKITKRDTPPIVDNTKNNSTKVGDNLMEMGDKTNTGNEDELIETKPADLLPSSEASNVEQSEKDDQDSNTERSIDWQLLSGNPADLERELEARRRRRSVIRSSALSRQHRIRTTTNRLQQRSRSKRDAYAYETVNPSDLLAAYAYLQARRQNEELQDEQQPQVSLLDDQVSDGDLANLASLIYELQRNGQQDNDDESMPLIDENESIVDDDDDQVLPSGYVDFEPDTDLQTAEIRMTPEQLAALEQVLSEQQGQQFDDDSDDQQDDNAGLYPKDKRSQIDDPMFLQDENEDTTDDIEDEEPIIEPGTTYLIPASLEQPQTEYVQVPISAAGAYENPYDFYQLDDDEDQNNLYDEALRRLDEEQLRQRIASLVEDINEQRQMGRRRR